MNDRKHEHFDIKTISNDQERLWIMRG